MCYHVKIKRKMNTTFYFQINDQIERQNQTLKHYLRCYCNYKQNNWAFLLTIAQYVYNNALHAFSKLTFFEAMYEHQNDFTWKWNDKNCFDMFAIKKRIQILWNERNKFIDRLRNVQQSQVRNHDKKITSKIYRLKKQIMFSIKNFKNAKSKKKIL